MMCWMARLLESLLKNLHAAEGLGRCLSGLIIWKQYDDEAGVAGDDRVEITFPPIPIEQSYDKQKVSLLFDAMGQVEIP